MAAFGVAVITKEVFVEIQLLRKHGFSLRQIAREVGCAVNTVRRQLSEGQMPKYERKVKQPTKLQAYESYLRARQESAKPLWIPATVLLREIAQRGYLGGQTQLRAFLRTLKPAQAMEPVVRFETAPGEQLQVDWVEFRKGVKPLYAFCATLGYSRASYVEFVSDMKVQTLVACHEHAFGAFDGVPKRVLYDNMKTVVLENVTAMAKACTATMPGFWTMRATAGLSSSCASRTAPRQKAKGKVERFNGYLRRSFYVPLSSRLRQAGLQLDVVTANIEVSRWLQEVANQRVHGTTQARPSDRLRQERASLQAIVAPWRGDMAAARPVQSTAMQATDAPGDAPANLARPAAVAKHIAQAVPMQHPLAVYEQLLSQITQGAAV